MLGLKLGVTHDPISCQFFFFKWGSKLNFGSQFFPPELKITEQFGLEWIVSGKFIHNLHDVSHSPLSGNLLKFRSSATPQGGNLSKVCSSTTTQGRIFRNATDHPRDPTILDQGDSLLSFFFLSAIHKNF